MLNHGKARRPQRVEGLSSFNHDFQLFLMAKLLACVVNAAGLVPQREEHTDEE